MAGKGGKSRWRGDFLTYVPGEDCITHQHLGHKVSNHLPKRRHALRGKSKGSRPRRFFCKRKTVKVL